MSTNLQNISYFAADEFEFYAVQLFMLKLTSKISFENQL